MASPFAFGALDVDPATAEVAAEPWVPGPKDKVARGLLQGLGNMIATPGRAMKEGITTGEAADWAAPLAMGMVGMGRLPGMAPEGALVGSGGSKLIQPEGIRAYHGSPHDFDRFDISRIGTGEGAQAYGHGLYFAENPKVATDYRNKLSDGTSGYTGYRYGDQTFERGSPEWKMLGQIHNYGIRDARSLLKDYERAAVNREPYMVDMLSKEPDFLTKARTVVDSYGRGSKVEPVHGRMYEVNINAKPDDFLNFDAPISQQTAGGIAPLFQRVLRDSGYLRANENGPRQLDSAMKQFRLERGGMADSPMEAMLNPSRGLLGKSPEAVSQTLREADVPGVKYLDEGSRARKRGTSNYVLFDDALVDIMRKYAIPGAVGGGAAFGSFAPDGGS